MTTILPSARTPWHVLDQQIGQQISNNLPGAVQQGFNRGQLRNSLDEISQLAGSNASPLEIMLATMKAGAGIPGSERYLGAIMPELVKFAQAQRGQNAPLAGETGAGLTQQAPRSHEIPQMPQQRQQMPGFMGQQGLQAQQQTPQFFPSVSGPQGEPGHIPKTATGRQKMDVLPRDQWPAASKKLAAENTRAGIPMTPKEALNEIKEAEQDKIEYNKLIDEELKQQVAAQENYGKRGVEYLKKVYPNPTPEMETIFQKEGETLARKGDSEADINRALAKKAQVFGNAIANVNKSLSAPRTQNAIGRAVNGTYKSFDAAANDARTAVQPLMDLGLYDTARDLLQDRGYGPEEREMILHPLDDRSQSYVNQLPSIKGIPTITAATGTIPDVDMNAVKDTIKKMKQSDPNFSLLLARKAFEDRGYNWRVFKDALNELEFEGFKLEDDQASQRGYLDTPPLSMLESILHGLNIIGR